jgi:hypothetical protein
MTEPVCNVLFLSTGKSACSIIGEALVNRPGAGRIRGFSAGGFKNGEVHSMAIDVQWKQLEGSAR